MADSFIASIQGLEVIDKVRRLKGWNKDAVAWQNAAGVSRSTLQRFWGRQEPIRQEFFIAICKAIGIDDWQSIIDPPRQIRGFEDAPEASHFVGRNQELAILEQWIVEDGCQLVVIFGMAGIGKTSLTVKLGEGGIGKTNLSLKFAKEITKTSKGQFKYIVWKSLDNAPPISSVLTDLIKILSNQKKIELPDNINEQISQFLTYMQDERCLIILDDLGKSGWQKQYGEGYDILLKKIATVRHQSCLLLTSREKPREVIKLEGEKVRCLPLHGLGYLDGRQILEHKALERKALEEDVNFVGSDDEWKELIEIYFEGNPLALKIAADQILEVFNGEIGKFLQQPKKVLDDMRKDFLDWHFERLSDEEKEVVYWLAINRDFTSISDLNDDIISPTIKDRVNSIISSIKRQLPLENNGGRFRLQPVLREYVTERFIEKVCEEIKAQESELENIKNFNSHAIIKALAKDYVRESQIELILKPILNQLLIDLGGIINLETKLNQILTKSREEVPQRPGYIGGNILNLLRQIVLDRQENTLRDWDFSYLCVWQACLQGLNLHTVNFAYSDLSKSLFSQIFGGVLSVAFSPDGTVIAIGDVNGAVHLWRDADNQKIGTCLGHNDWIRSIAFSPNGELLASSSEDKTIRLWDLRAIQAQDTSALRCIKILRECGGEVWCIAFNSDGRILASGSEDGILRLWDAQTHQCIRMLHRHTRRIRSVAFSSDGQILASSGEDGMICLWNSQTGEYIKTLPEVTDKVWSVAFSHDGKILASGDNDRVVRLWDIESEECLNVLLGHSNSVLSIAFNNDDKTLVSGSSDKTVRLWEVSTGRCLHTFYSDKYKHTSRITSVALRLDGQVLASGSDDRTVRLWDTQNGKHIDIFQGYANWIWCVAFSPDGQLLASGSDDQTVRLWNVRTGQCQKILQDSSKQGHQDRIWCVAFSFDGKILASGSDDQKIKLWNVNSGKSFKTLEGHTNRVTSIVFNPSGQTLASSSHDCKVILWDVRTGDYRELSEQHPERIWSLAFSPCGQILASASNDNLIRLWDIDTGRCIQTFQATPRIRCVTFSRNGQIMASCGDDRIVRLWDINTGECLRSLQGHTGLVYSVAFCSNDHILVSSGNELIIWDINADQHQILDGHSNWIFSVAFSPDGQTLASGSQDETIRLWSTNTGECLNVLRPDRPYEGMNITGATGLINGQKEMLQALGAIEDEM